MRSKLPRMSALVPIALGGLALTIVVLMGASQPTAASSGMIPSPTAVQAPVKSPEFLAPAAARRTGCPVQCGGGKLAVLHAAGQEDTDKFIPLCLPTPAWNEHCFLDDERGTPTAGHEEDDCCPLPD